jgi:hypothetical protein
MIVNVWDWRKQSQMSESLFSVKHLFGSMNFRNTNNKNIKEDKKVLKYKIYF